MPFKNLISVIELIFVYLRTASSIGEQSLIPGIAMESRCILGIRLPLGQTFMGLAVATFFQYFIVKSEMLSHLYYERGEPW